MKKSYVRKFTQHGPHYSQVLWVLPVFGDATVQFFEWRKQAPFKPTTIISYLLTKHPEQDSFVSWTFRCHSTFFFPHLFHLPALPPVLPQPGLFDLLRSHWGSSSYSFEVSSDFRVLGMHTLPLSKPHQALPTLREALLLSKGTDFHSSWSLQMNCGLYIKLWVFIYLGFGIFWFKACIAMLAYFKVCKLSLRKGEKKKPELPTVEFYASTQSYLINILNNNKKNYTLRSTE